LVAGGGFYSYYIHQGNKSDKERKFVSKSFIHTKRFNNFFKRWVQCRVGAIPRLPYFTNTKLKKIFLSFIEKVSRSKMILFLTLKFWSPGDGFIYRRKLNFVLFKNTLE